MRHLAKILLVLSLVAAMVGCNTVDGVGKDISSGGKALSRASGK